MLRVNQSSLKSETQRILRSLIECAKPGPSSMVIATFAIGVLLGLPGQSSFLNLLLASIGTTLLVGGANIWNCWLERDVDPFMSCTKNLPLVTGRLKNFEAVLGAIATSFAGLALLFYFSKHLESRKGEHFPIPLQYELMVLISQCAPNNLIVDS